MPEFISDFKKDIFSITQSNFEKEALKVFHYQKENNELYRKYISYLSMGADKIDCINKIPFLPIEFFKTHQVLCSNRKIETIFESSGTTGNHVSKHYVTDVKFYNEVAEYAFEQVYGSLNDYVILALLPSYLERTTSSLVYMVDKFIQKSAKNDSGFYLNNLTDLKLMVNKYVNSSQKVLLIGVSFALLDFSEVVDFPLTDNIMVMETGGMKGRRKEMIREELHEILKDNLGVEKIHSEYGMTEMLSQAYLSDKLFTSPEWMKILVREIDDPFAIKNEGRGVVNVIDLANVESCSFLALQDLAHLNTDGTFQILGRVDQTDVRGCNLMYV